MWTGIWSIWWREKGTIRGQPILPDFRKLWNLRYGSPLLRIKHLKKRKLYSVDLEISTKSFEDSRTSKIFLSKAFKSYYLDCETSRIKEVRKIWKQECLNKWFSYIVPNRDIKILYSILYNVFSSNLETSPFIKHSWHFLEYKSWNFHPTSATQLW